MKQARSQVRQPTSKMSVPTKRGVDLATPRVPAQVQEAPSREGVYRRVVGSLAPRVLGAGLLVATGALHLDLYLTGYRTIPTIGALFLLQVITSFALALALLVTGSRIAAAAGAGFVLSTLAGYLISLRTPLFSFREVRTEAGITAGIVEVVAFTVLVAVALGPAGTSNRGPKVLTVPLERLAVARTTRWAGGALCALTAVTLSVSLLTTPAAPSSSGAGSALLDVTTIGGATVLTNAQGLTLYWFGLDTPTTSACDDTNCTPYWPPEIGTPSAGAGVTGTLGTMRRSDGRTQATYDGHPLYSYVSDSGPGQANGNNVTLNGGVWHEMLASGAG